MVIMTSYVVESNDAAVPLPERPGKILALNIGRAGTMQQGNRIVETAFKKKPVEGPLQLGKLGFVGDEQVYEHHGGPHKAVCVYPHEHYSYWADRLDIEMPESAAFGENFTLAGLTERQVCLGDIFEVGDAIVQITQPRAPCFKIAVRYGIPKMAIYVQQESYTGYLLRVLQEGQVQAGDTMTLVERPEISVTVAEANQILNVRKKDVEGAERLLAIPSLPEPLRVDLDDRIRQHGSAEDVERLFGEF